MSINKINKCDVSCNGKVSVKLVEKNTINEKYTSKFLLESVFCEEHMVP